MALRKHTPRFATTNSRESARYEVRLLNALKEIAEGTYFKGDEPVAYDQMPRLGIPVDDITLKGLTPAQIAQRALEEE